jgi:hypothetical protein
VPTGVELLDGRAHRAHEVDLACGAVAPAVQVAAQHQAAAQAGADRQEGELVDAAAGAVAVLARGEVHVVLDAHVKPQPLLQRRGEPHAVQARDALGQRDRARRVGDDAGHADDDRVDPRGGQAGRGQHAILDTLAVRTR